MFLPFTKQKSRIKIMKQKIFKYTFVLLALFFGACENMDISSGQADTFIKIFGSWNSDIGVDVKSFNDGYVVLATITDIESGNGDADIAIIFTDKYGNQNGNIDTIDGGGNDIAGKLLKTSDGGFIVVGTLYDTLYHNEDILLVKYSPEGQLTWQKTLGGTSSNEQGKSIKSAQSGYIIVGNTDDNPQETWDILMVKVDAEGNLEWQNIFSGTGTDKANDVIMHSNGYLIVGETNSFYEAGQASYNIMAIKTNFTGGETDKFTYGGTHNDYGNSVIEVDDGFIIAGSVENIAGGNSDAYILKVEKDDLIDIIWNKSFGSNLNDFAYGIIKTNDDVVVVGSQENITGAYGLFLNIDSEGNSLYSNTLGGYNQVFRAIERTPDGGFILTGSTGAQGNEQIMLVKLNSDYEL